MYIIHKGNLTFVFLIVIGHSNITVFCDVMLYSVVHINQHSEKVAASVFGVFMFSPLNPSG
jgi:hypothetical protein